MTAVPPQAPTIMDTICAAVARLEEFEAAEQARPPLVLTVEPGQGDGIRAALEEADLARPVTVQESCGVPPGSAYLMDPARILTSMEDVTDG